MHAFGREAALRHYGIKTASYGQMARDLLIGPKGTWKRLATEAKGRMLTEPGGLYHRPYDWLIPRIELAPAHAPFSEKLMAGLNTAGSIAQPLGLAHSAYQALTAPEDYRGQAVGGLAGGLVGGTLGSPFGLVGNMVGGTLGGIAGGAAGRLFDHATKKKPVENPPEYAVPAQ